MTSTLFILNDAPYGNERAYNALRLALSLAKTERESVAPAWMHAAWRNPS